MTHVTLLAPCQISKVFKMFFKNFFGQQVAPCGINNKWRDHHICQLLVQGINDLHYAIISNISVDCILRSLRTQDQTRIYSNCIMYHAGGEISAGNHSIYLYVTYPFHTYLHACGIKMIQWFGLCISWDICQWKHSQRDICRNIVTWWKFGNNLFERLM